MRRFPSTTGRERSTVLDGSSPSLFTSRGTALPITVAPPRSAFRRLLLEAIKALRPLVAGVIREAVADGERSRQSRSLVQIIECHPAVERPPILHLRLHNFVQSALLAASPSGGLAPTRPVAEVTMPRRTTSTGEIVHAPRTRHSGVRLRPTPSGRSKSTCFRWAAAARRSRRGRHPGRVCGPRMSCCLNQYFIGLA